MLLPKWLDSRLKTFLEHKGYARVRGEDGPALARRKRLFDFHGIDLVIDVGANAGQFGEQIRMLGFNGQIHSFEPMASAWSDLQKRIRHDKRWSATRCALGESHGSMSLHISENSISSSFLDMLPKHSEHSARSAFVRNETVRVSTLDHELKDLHSDARHIWLKIDVQGYEDRVLAGGRASLNLISIIQLELSLTPLYSGQATFLPLCEFLASQNFEMIGVEAGFQERQSGALLQVDGIFRNRSHANPAK